MIKGPKYRFEDIVEREYLYYERVEMPKHDIMYRLAQLLNPGFDGKIKVYVFFYDQACGYAEAAAGG